MDDSCAVCADALEWVAYGPCGHREAMGDYTKVILDFSVLPTEANEGNVGEYWYHEDTKAYFDDADHYKMIRAMCRLSCSVCDKAEDQVFICEQKLYTRAQLAQHTKTGDSEVDGSEIERSGFAGHPVCEFCKYPLYGDNELYTHMSREHYSCHICQRQHPGQYDYFRNYDDLEMHFRKDHFLCEDDACLAKKFVVFQSDAEIKRHNAMEHGGRMSRAQRNAALQIPTSFIYQRNEQDQRRGRGRGHNAHHDRFDRDFSLSVRDGSATADHGLGSRVDSVAGPFQSLSVSSSSGRSRTEIGRSLGNRRVLEQLSFPPLQDQDIPDARIDAVPYETLFPPVSEQQSRYALALNQSSRGSARLGDESLFPPLPGSSNKGSASTQQGLQSLAKNTLASRLQQRSKGTVKASSSTAYGNKKQLPPQSSQPLPVVEDVRQANKSLVERMRVALGMDEDRFSAFKEIASEYRQGVIDTSEYLSYVEQFGISHLVPEMAKLLPDPLKQMELADAYYTNMRFKSLQENGGCETITVKENKRKNKGKGKTLDAETATAKDASESLADSFMDTVRKLQSNNKAQEGEAAVLSKDGYRSSKEKIPLSAGGSSCGTKMCLDGDPVAISKASGTSRYVGKGGGSTGSSSSSSSNNKQSKKTSKFLRARLGDNSLATLDFSHPDVSPERPERETQVLQTGLPVRSVWKNGAAQKLFSSNGKK
ncbi:unnamed protein product [Triticum turgidum subsp. durum]|uniref:RING-type E3 ubiquitin transferase n=1 Tax=Triticum turgidum subsp. durum TaxID=4567 RepID=A0A9R0QSU4_TRITD|nr:unnamed protein product [Triticum turgidum subsp. durum]